MAKPKHQKTFKVEFEVTVELDDVREEHLRQGQLAEHTLEKSPGAASRVLPHLKRLQKALLKDETALVEQMKAAVLSKLQEYIDTMAMQDTLASLARLAASLEPEDRAFFQKYRSDFADLTLPLRTSSLSTRLTRGVIQEKVDGASGEAEWQPVWSDLLPESELGRLLDRLPSLVVPARSDEREPDFPDAKYPGDDEDCEPCDPHYLQARYLTRQRDGVHAEARCTCEEILEGVGEDESQALEALWDAFEKHYDLYAL